jgi:hypothetical protein
MLRRGYDAVVASTEDVRGVVEKAEGVKFMSVGPSPLSAGEVRESLSRASTETSGLRGILTLMNDVYLPLSLPLYGALLPLLTTNASDIPDLIVMDVGAAAARDLGATLGVPVVFNSPSLLFTLDPEPAYSPAWGTGFGVNMSLLERCLNFLFPRLLSFALTGPFIAINRVRCVGHHPPRPGTALRGP